MRLRTYQIEGRDFLRRRRYAILGDEMGLGKTAQYATAIGDAGGKLALVFAPEATLPGLMEEIQAWTGAAPRTVSRSGPMPALEGWVLCGWTSAHKRRKDLTAGKHIDYLVLDEAHRLKNAKANVTKAVLGPIASHADRIWAVTGTPIPNRPIELQPLLSQGFGIPWASYHAFGQRYCLRANYFTKSGVDYLGARNLEELSSKLVEAQILLRRRAEDVPGELPELQVTLVPLAVKEPPVPLSERAVAQIVSAGEVPDFTEMSAYRREVGLAKAGPCCEWIKGYLDDSNKPLVVYCHHKEVASALAKGLAGAGIRGFLATGDTAAGKRQGMVERFAGGEGTVFIGSIEACGTGLNGLHKRTSTCCFVEAPWVPGTLAQAIGRVRRIGGVAGGTTAYILVGEESLERHILKTIIRKSRVISTVLGEEEA